MDRQPENFALSPLIRQIVVPQSLQTRDAVAKTTGAVARMPQLRVFFENARQIDISVRFGAPTHRRAERQSEVADWQYLPMSAVTPVRIEQTQRAVFQPGLRRIRDICDHVVSAPSNRVPRARPRADVEWNARSGEFTATCLERKVRFIAPFKRDGILRQPARRFGCWLTISPQNIIVRPRALTSR